MSTDLNTKNKTLITLELEEEKSAELPPFVSWYNLKIKMQQEVESSFDAVYTIKCVSQADIQYLIYALQTIKNKLKEAFNPDSDVQPCLEATEDIVLGRFKSFDNVTDLVEELNE